MLPLPSVSAGKENGWPESVSQDIGYLDSRIINCLRGISSSLIQSAWPGSTGVHVSQGLREIEDSCESRRFLFQEEVFCCNVEVIFLKLVSEAELIMQTLITDERSS